MAHLGCDAKRTWPPIPSLLPWGLVSGGRFVSAFPRDYSPPMTEPTNPHDSLVRALLESPERAGVFLRESLPEALRARLGSEPPQLVEGHFVDEALRDSQSDRLYQLPLPDGQTALLYVLLEHKSRPDPGTPVQLLGYMSRIWQRWADGKAIVSWLRESLHFCESEWRAPQGTGPQAGYLPVKGR